MRDRLEERLRRLRDEDAGVSMMEITVSLTIMAILMTIVTTSVLQVYTSTNRTESITTSQSRMNALFLRLDKEIRYASGISLEQQVTTGVWWVEYLSTRNGVATCTELRLTKATSKLESRTWEKDKLPLTPSPWQLLAEKVGPPVDRSGSTPVEKSPFEFKAADPAGVGVAASNFDRLQISLVGQALESSSKTDTGTTVMFTAMNTTAATSTQTTCTEGRSVA